MKNGPFSVLAPLFIHCLVNPQISWVPMTDLGILDLYFFSAKYFIAWTGFPMQILF